MPELKKTVCPNCNKEVDIPMNNLKQFPCPECFQAVCPPPPPLTKNWIIFASICGVLLLLAILLPFVMLMVKSSVDNECAKINANFESSINKLSASIKKEKNREQELLEKEEQRQQQLQAARGAEEMQVSGELPPQ